MIKLNFSGKILLSSLKTTFVPFASLILLFMLAVYTFFFAKSKVLSHISAFKEKEANILVLEEKIKKLGAVSESMPRLVDASVMVLPQDNSALYFITQAKLLASQEPIIVKSFKVGNETVGKETNSTVEVELGLEGNPTQLFDFLKKMCRMAPLSTLLEGTLVKTGTLYDFNVKYRIYYASLPSIISKISDPFTEFTKEEEATLAKVTQFTLPTVTEISPQAPATRANPFE